MKCPHCNNELVDNNGWVLKCPKCRYVFLESTIKGEKYLMRWIDKNSCVTKKLVLYGDISALTDKEIIDHYGGIFGGYVSRSMKKAQVHVYVD